MAEFIKRGLAFENKFAHDETLRFKTIARRNKLFGLWAAQKLGRSGIDAEVYANKVVIADLEEPGDDDVIRKVLSDLDAGGVSIDEGQVRRALESFVDRAADEIRGGL
jgi:hypothetical protein